MNLLSLTPTGVVPPIIRLVEANDDPYALPEETIEELYARLDAKLKSMRSYQEFLWAEQERILKVFAQLTPDTRKHSWNVFNNQRSLERDQVLTPAIMNAIQQLPADQQKYYDRLLDKHIEYNHRLVAISALTERVTRAGAKVKAAQTREAKNSLQQGQATSVVVPKSIPSVFNVNGIMIANPYFSPALSKIVSQTRHIIRKAGTIYDFLKYHHNNTLREVSILTDALKRNNKEWDVTYGRMIFKKEDDELKKAFSMWYVATTKDNSVFFKYNDGRADMIYNSKGHDKSLYYFEKLSLADQDKFISGKKV